LPAFTRSHRTHSRHDSAPTFTLPINTAPNPFTHPLLQNQRLKRCARQRQEGLWRRLCGRARAVVGPSQLRLYVRCVCGGGATAEAAAAQPRRPRAAAAAQPRRPEAAAATRLRRRSRGGCASIPWAWARRSVGAVSTAERWRVAGGGQPRRTLCGGGGRVGAAAGGAAGGDRSCGASTSRTSAARAAAPRLGLHRARVGRRRRFDRGTPQRLSGRLGTPSPRRASSSRCVRCPPAFTASSQTSRIRESPLPGLLLRAAPPL
jgi:hypothetical protein